MLLKEIRKNKGLTQQEASLICDIPLRSYKRLENDTNYQSSSRYKQAYEMLEGYVANSNSGSSSYNILVIGAGYVGLSISVLLSTANNVSVVDIDKNKVDKINKRIPIFKDKEIEQYLSKKNLNLTAYLPSKDLFKDKDYIIICLPTDYDENKNVLKTDNIVSLIKEIRTIDKKVTIVIKSTCPIGFTDSLNDNIVIYCPEFLREGKALLDNLYPNRIVIGGDRSNNKVKRFGTLLQNSSFNRAKLLYMSPKEAEAVKLFSNAYLALRVAYFNELDSFAIDNDIDSNNVIQGVSLDTRIGDYYNNPSFGYGGYCLPKDTLALIHQMSGVSNNNLISSINESNVTRKELIVNNISNKLPIGSRIGVYSLASKQGSDNKRNASISDIITGLENKGYTIIYFDKEKQSLDDFADSVDLILTNRMDELLLPYKDKAYTRDLFKRD